MVIAFWYVKRGKVFVLILTELGNKHRKIIDTFDGWIYNVRDPTKI